MAKSYKQGIYLFLSEFSSFLLWMNFSHQPKNKNVLFFPISFLLFIYLTAILPRCVKIGGKTGMGQFLILIITLQEFGGPNPNANSPYFSPILLLFSPPFPCGPPCP
jgi:hypothetical protein